MKRPGRIETVACTACNRVVRGRIPQGGDGSAVYPYRHKATDRLRGSAAPRRTRGPTMATQIDLDDGSSVTRVWHAAGVRFEIHGLRNHLHGFVTIQPTEAERVKLAELLLHGVSPTVVQEMADRLRRER